MRRGGGAFCVQLCVSWAAFCVSRGEWQVVRPALLPVWRELARCPVADSKARGIAEGPRGRRVSVGRRQRGARMSACRCAGSLRVTSETR